MARRYATKHERQAHKEAAARIRLFRGRLTGDWMFALEVPGERGRQVIRLGACDGPQRFRTWNEAEAAANRVGLTVDWHTGYAISMG